MSKYLLKVHNSKIEFNDVASGRKVTAKLERIEEELTISCIMPGHEKPVEIHFSNLGRDTTTAREILIDDCTGPDLIEDLLKDFTKT